MAKCDHCGKKIPMFGGVKYSGKQYHTQCLLKAQEEETRLEIQKKIPGMSQDEFYGYVLKFEDPEDQNFALDAAAGHYEPDWIEYVRRACGDQKREKGIQCCKEAWDAQDKRDYRLARQRFKEAAELGNPDGMYNYARLCFKFDDYAEGKLWLKKAIESGTYDDEHTRQLLEYVQRGGVLNIED